MTDWDAIAEATYSHKNADERDKRCWTCESGVPHKFADMFVCVRRHLLPVSPGKGHCQAWGPRELYLEELIEGGYPLLEIDTAELDRIERELREEPDDA